MTSDRALDAAYGFGRRLGVLYVILRRLLTRR